MDQVLAYIIYYIALLLLNHVGPTVQYNAEYGPGYGPPVWSNVACNGWEKSIHDCTKDVYPSVSSLSCPMEDIAGVSCRDGVCKK